MSRQRTPEQKATIVRLSAFWKCGPGGDRTGMSAPWKTDLDADGNVRLWWWYPPDAATRVHAFGAMVDWCADHGVECGWVPSEGVPGFKYIYRATRHRPSPKVFRVVVPGGPPRVRRLDPRTSPDE